MNGKPTLLVVGDYNRKDFIDLFGSCKDDFTFYFIEYASEKEVSSRYAESYGKILFWKNFSDAYQLLHRLQPSVVVFFFIETYNHVAVNVACKELGITTVHLEHGVRDFERTAAISKKATSVQHSSKLKRLGKILPQIWTKYRTRRFFTNTQQLAKPETAAFLKQYFDVRSRHSIFETFQQVRSLYRVADQYVSFSPSIFKAHQQADHLAPDYPVTYIGIPTFDNWKIPKQPQPPERIVLFIDQAFVNQGLLGWTLALQRQFIQELAAQCASAGFTLKVKLHPRENHVNWKAAEQLGLLTIIGSEELEQLADRAVAVGGYYSTMLMPLAAMPQSVVFTFENHPIPGIFPSKFLVNCGVAEKVEDVTSFALLLGQLNSLREKQVPHKQAFLHNWLYKLDGAAGERLRTFFLQLSKLKVPGNPLSQEL